MEATWNNREANLWRSHNYYFQVTGHIVITEAAFCDLLLGLVVITYLDSHGQLWFGMLKKLRLLLHFCCTWNHQIICSNVTLLQIYLRFVTRKTYHFPQTRRVRFPKVAARQYVEARAPMQGSSVQQSTDRLRGNARTLRRSIHCGKTPQINTQACAHDRRRVLGSEAVSL